MFSIIIFDPPIYLLLLTFLFESMVTLLLAGVCAYWDLNQVGLLVSFFFFACQNVFGFY